ncbi:peptidase S24/S26A/S26B/S26C [Hygrophoropsis aurantiaca]|uniref:Peptidase S24/S26A/S26B/S26C n=1 Tax=Hygrophoropsis aurantiaca TaxID=72124 RepID=A0ACB8AU54_9AGAM|nr:peptidase S24/S26A/S26B/S26C [Hygrophoropsis aurantiaca]
MNKFGPTIWTRWLSSTRHAANEKRWFLKGSFVLKFVYWFPLGLGFTHYFYTLKTVKGRSMQPTLNPDTSAWNDVVVFDRFSVHFRLPDLQRGDVVALRDPIQSNKTIVKRIVALPGDTVKTLPPYPLAEVLVPPGHVWVEAGDEPFRTLDSNKFGPVPMALIDSKLSHIVWPLDRIGPLRSPTKPRNQRGSPRNHQWYREMAAFERERRRQSRVTPLDSIGN